MVSASRWNVGIVVGSNLKRVCEQNESRFPPNGGVESIKGHYTRSKIINKWTARAQAPEAAAAGISPASVVKRQAGFEYLAGPDAFITDLSANPGEQPRPLRIAAVVDVEAALPDMRAVIAQ